MQHTWSITNLERNLSDGLVTTASYTCNTTYSGSMKRMVGDYSLPSKSPSDPDFVSYDDLYRPETKVNGSTVNIGTDYSNASL